jgi:dipeptidyl aminopeptidase/acylaminoacyl peptidase
LTTAPYGTWRSPVTAELIARLGYFGVDQAEADGDTVYWTESRPQQDGRTTILRRDAAGRVGEALDATYNARTTVHEYGGRCFTVADDTLWFTHLGDNRIYRVCDGRAAPLTPDDPQLRYADLCFDPHRRALFCVREDHRAAGEPVNSVVRLAADEPGEPVPIVTGHDFYAYPRLRPDGTRLAWIAWRHPNMPWDGTELCTADLDASGEPGPVRVVAGGNAESVLFPQWSADGGLAYLSDRDGRWSLYYSSNGGTERIGPTDVDCGGIPRVIGPAPFDPTDAHGWWAAISRDGVQELIRSTADLRHWETVPTPFTFFLSVRSFGPAALVVAAGPLHDIGAYRVDPDGQFVQLSGAGDGDLPDDYVAVPDAIAFRTNDGQTAHAFFYPPTNPDFQGPPETRPPLIVNAHGGPVAATFPTKSLDIQFWTTRGFAVLDVNYRGSIGYGRDYREQLYGRWGEVDVEDCMAAARHVLDRQLADPARVVIRGASAGGYTVLAALAFRDFFHAGMSFCGVSDPERFTRPGGTHKFESHYLEHLLGAYPEHIDRYRSRSPLHNADRIQAPLLLLQGVDDPVVPVEQARLIADSLRRRGVPVELAEFAGEGHGFRRSESLRRFYETELRFLTRLFDLTVGADAGSRGAAPQAGVS